MSTGIKLNLGCGNDIQDGYINIDFRQRKGVVDHDLTKPLPYKDGSVEEVRAMDIIEHFDKFKVMGIIKDWCRVISPGGLMIIKTPDIKNICERYYPKAKSGEITWEKLSTIIHGGQNYHGNFHEVSFSFEWLSDILSKHGMINFNKRDAGNQNMIIKCSKANINEPTKAHENRGSVSQKYENYLKLLKNNNQPKGRHCWRVAEWLCSHKGDFKSILEIGRDKGHSLGLFKHLWPESKIISIDIVEHKEVFGILDLFKAHDSVKLINGGISNLRTEKIFDLVLIDGDHSYSGAKKDWEGIQQNIKEGSIVIFDDLDHPGGCGRAFFEVVSKGSYRTEQIEAMGIVYI